MTAATNEGFVKLVRNGLTLELLADMPAMHLLTVIAARARFSDAPNLHGLAFGQALIGDCAAIGMTQKEYRCAKQRLERYGLATFHGSPRGTIATLSGSKVFSIRDERNSEKKGDLKGELFSEVKTDERANSRANEGRTKGEHGATNKKERRKESILAPFGAKAERERNPLLDALVAIDGSSPAEVTGPAWGAAAKAIAEIKAVCADVTPAEIMRRAGNYRTHFAEAAISPNALSKHWARCQNAGATATQPQPQRDYPPM